LGAGKCGASNLIAAPSLFRVRRRPVSFRLYPPRRSRDTSFACEGGITLGGYDMDKDNARTAGLKRQCVGLTHARRWCLKAIVEGRTTFLVEPACQSLVDVGLLRRTGNTFVATYAGCYVATLF